MVLGLSLGKEFPVALIPVQPQSSLKLCLTGGESLDGLTWKKPREFSLYTSPRTPLHTLLNTLFLHFPEDAHCMSCLLGSFLLTATSFVSLYFCTGK